jgi:hypothetical protein
MIFFRGNLFNRRYIKRNRKEATAAEIRVIYQPAVPTISTTLPALVKKALMDMVITIELMAS